MNYTGIANFELWMGRDYLTANHLMLDGPSGGHKTTPNSIRWSPPRAGFVELNFNDSVIDQHAASGFCD